MPSARTLLFIALVAIGVVFLVRWIQQVRGARGIRGYRKLRSRLSHDDRLSSCPSPAYGSSAPRSTACAPLLDWRLEESLRC